MTSENQKLIQACESAGNTRVCVKCQYKKVCRLYEPTTSAGPGYKTKVPRFDYKDITPSILTADDDEDVAPI